MAVPTIPLDENSPVGESDYIRDGDDAIRTHKTQVRELMEIDHVYPSSGTDADGGKHKQVTLLEQADIGAGSTGKCALGAQTIGAGAPELVFTDEANSDVQITSGGKIKAENLSGVYPVANLAAMATMMNLIYPIGYVITLGVLTNPATLLGIGTWTAIVGKVIVGIDGTQTEFDTLNETGGAKTVTLDVTQMPAHTHTLSATGEGAVLSATKRGDTTVYGDHTTSSTGGGLAHNNLQPYIVKYVWERTA